MSSSEKALAPKQILATNADDSEPITSEPKAPSMSTNRNSSDRNSTDRDTMATYSDNESGYHRESNECTEFCLDLFSCFGACEACCPSTGEGCLSSTAAFFGGICMTFCKC